MPTQSPSSMVSESTFRPKAKVSSSAAMVAGRSSSSSTDNSTVKSTTRPPSPSKQSHGHARKLSSTRSAVDVHTSRPKASLMPHELSRQRSLTSTLEASIIGARRGNDSSQHTLPASPSPRLSPDNPSTSPAVRVKARVSSVVKSNGFSTSPTPANSLHASPPPFATIRPIESRPRAPSITDFSSLGSRPVSPSVSTVPVVVYPITTPTSAANPHRYAPRIVPSTASARFQSLSPPSNRDLDGGVHCRISSEVDTAAIPLPPQSPPVSTLSFSSQSSKSSQSSSVSGSIVPTPNSHVHGSTLTAGERGPVLGSGPAFDMFDDLCDPNSPRHSLDSPAAYVDQLGASDRKIRAEAKTNRKIEDLEITNKSLLAINATLEAAKHRQANEIRELRRKLRETRLILPPRAFRAVKSSLSPEDMADDEDVDDYDNDEDGDEHDETYSRIKGILEDLLETGRRALRAKPQDFANRGSGVKVLSAEEVRSWRGDMGDDLSSIHSAPTDADIDEENRPLRTPPTPSQATVLRDSDTSPSKDDNERAVLMGRDENNAGSLPPITVTFS
ncbi:hypothetical protein BJV74DRAFT_809613 [Russula compacta]|nr:hypothetical protein BJV74DRAFT_809613 [Russula compacta]